MKSSLRPIHPGEILREEFIKPLNITPHAVAIALHVPPARINAIVRTERGVTADTALRLARFFGTTPQFWLNLQQAYELRLAEMESGVAIEASIQPYGEKA